MPGWQPSLRRHRPGAPPSTFASTCRDWRRTRRCAPRLRMSSTGWRPIWAVQRHRRWPTSRRAWRERKAGAVTGRSLDGKAIASRMWRNLSERSEVLREATGEASRLAILRADDTGPVVVYAASLARAARSVAVAPMDVAPPAGAPVSDIAARIGALNRDA